MGGEEADLVNKIYNGRFTADNDQEFVVFIIGMRFNKLLAFRKWVPVFMAMGPMIKELYQHPKWGFLHTEFAFGWRTVTLIQYWKSFEGLEGYAHGKTHAEAWKNFNQKVNNDGSVGIFHETYKIGRNGAESIYNNMPKFGLAKAFSHVPVTKGRETARSRIEKNDET